MAKLPGRFVGSGSPFAIALKRSTGITGAWCVGMEAVLANYPGTSSPPMGTVGPLVQAALDDSAASLQGPRPPAGKARRRCINTIGRVRSKIVHQILAQAVRCQRAIDRTATSFGLISPACLGPAQHVAGRSRTIVQACAGYTGADVGSCGPLPTCVIASATQTGHDLAVATYGFSPDQQGDLCGNGKVDPGESCDDGAANSPTGACTDECIKAACGDGKVEAGVEECDPGPQQGSSSPKTDDPDCNANCKLTYCGDGIVQTGGTRPDEQCDDGNTVAGDGCSPTCQFETVSCPAGGTIDVTVAFVGDSSTYSGVVGGFDFSVAYPASVTFPGSGFLSVDDPNDPATRIVLLGGTYNLYQDYSIIFFDFDTYIRTDLVLSGAGFRFTLGGSLPFERIRFDCAPGTPLSETAFPCTVNMMVTPLGGTQLDPSVFPTCKITLPR